MLTRDSYVALLEKRAADTAESSIEPNDSAEATAIEYRKNMEDNRQYLHDIFPNAGEVQANQSATIKKMFDNIPSGAIVGTPLLKVARAVFFEAINRGHVKTASPIHAELSYRAFCDELEKIANLAGMGAGGAGGMAAPAAAATQGMKAPMAPSSAGGMSGASGSMGKLAALKAQTLAQVAQKNQIAMSRPAKAWNISPATAGAAGAKPQGSGTTLNQGGFFSRLLGR